MDALLYMAWVLFAGFIVGVFTLLTLTTPRRKGHPRPGVEWLGVRIVPADNLFQWAGPAGGNWSVVQNWIENGQAATSAPGNGDMVYLDSTANTSSNDDIADLRLASLQVANNSTLTLGFKLEVDGGVTFVNGTIAAAQNADSLNILGGAPSLNWQGGTLDSSAAILLGAANNIGTLTVGGTVTLNGGLDSYATATMSGGTSITMANANAYFTNDVGSTFNITADVGFLVPNGLMGHPTITNAGLFEKTGGNNSSAIDAAFTNETNGTLLAASGTISFTSHLAQTGGFTTLYGGGINCTNLPFDMSGGVLAGVGTFGGGKGVNQTAGTVIPGYGSPGGGGPSGTLTIVGDYTEARGATLVINTDPSSVSELVVQGNVDVSGALLVNRDYEFQPGVGSTFPFLTWQTINVNHYFSSVTIRNNAWSGQGGFLYFAIYEPNSMDQFDLIVNSSH